LPFTFSSLTLVSTLVLLSVSCAFTDQNNQDVRAVSHVQRTKDAAKFDQSIVIIIAIRPAAKAEKLLISTN